MLLGQALQYVSTRLLPFCPHQSALVYAEGDPPLNANRGRGFHVQGMAPGMVPSTTDDDPYLPHARTAQELGRLVSHPWLCVVERTPQFESISGNFLVSFVHTPIDVLETVMTNFLSLLYNRDGLWVDIDNLSLQAMKMPGPLTAQHLN
jgi:hypothetical protein